jgi:hypothetical protein
VNSIEIALGGICDDFAQTFMAVTNLHRALRKHPGRADIRVVEALGSVLAEDRFLAEPHCRMLYRESAGALVILSGHDQKRRIAGLARRLLHTTLLSASGPPRMAAAEALGSLPFEMPAQQAPATYDPPRSVRNAREFAPDVEPIVAGRSLLFRGGDTLTVVKLARPGEDLQGLHAEACWMERLGAMAFPAPMHVPRPLGLGNPWLFLLSPLPAAVRAGVMGAESVPAMAYRTVQDYFAYPIDDRPGELPDEDELPEILGRAALLFGHLAGNGLMHTAPIPLFHNRIQSGRREDAGVYEWRRMGRLDGWFRSCLAPNFARSGLRDFEHIEPASGPGVELYRGLATHLIALLLTAGAYFRCREPGRMGRTPDGGPVDARDLFDADLLARFVEAIMLGYFEGFVGKPYDLSLSLRAWPLVDRMIEEMGVDRHMREVFRAQDQLRMDRSGFERFLAERFMAPEDIAPLVQGADDIELLTGPHLGGFNRRISLPELVEHAASWAGLCVAARARRLDAILDPAA